MRVDVQPADMRVASGYARTAWVLGGTFVRSLRLVARCWAGMEPSAVDDEVRAWARWVFEASRTQLVVSEDVSVRGPAVLVSNHTSLLDVPAVIVAWRGPVRFVAKAELRRVPGFGAAMERAGAVFVDRHDRRRAIGQLEAARARLSAGESVWIAAEGSRSVDGRLQPLKKGAFHLARSFGVPLVPTWVHGAAAALPARALRSTTGQTVRVAFGAPLPAPGDGAGAIRESMAATREALLGLAERCAAEAGGRGGSTVPDHRVR